MGQSLEVLEGDASIRHGVLEERRPKLKDLTGQGISAGDRSCESKSTTISKKIMIGSPNSRVFLERFHHHPPASYLFKTDPPTIYLHKRHWLVVSSSPMFSPFLE